MKLQKFQVSKSKLLVNYKLYCFLKGLNSSPKLTDDEVSNLLITYYTNKSLLDENRVSSLVAILNNQIQNFKNLKDEKLEKLTNFIVELEEKLDLEIFIFALKLIQIKPLLYEEAKLTHNSEILNLNGINQLSLKYDNISKSKPYFTRVNGALLSLMFFEKLESRETNFVAESTQNYLSILVQEYKELLKNELEPNQIFMLMFSESINQGIISDAGSNYEDRVFNILVTIGIKPETISKLHDSNDQSTEYDFFFTLDGKNFGLGAKRTLRERYKQFIKTSYSTSIDVMIEITLGLDLTESKAKTIRQHDVFLIVSDEIFHSRKYLSEIGGIYPASQFNLKLLKSLTKN